MNKDLGFYLLYEYLSNNIKIMKNLLKHSYKNKNISTLFVNK